MNASIKLENLRIDYRAKLKNAEYTLSLDEQDDPEDIVYIMRQRSRILLLREFLDDLEF